MKKEEKKTDDGNDDINDDLYVYVRILVCFSGNDNTKTDTFYSACLSHAILCSQTQNETKNHFSSRH